MPSATTGRRGPILPGAAYPLPVFQSLVGWGRGAVREARRCGLRVITRHRRLFVLGSDFVEYLEKDLPDDGVA